MTVVQQDSESIVETGGATSILHVMGGKSILVTVIGTPAMRATFGDTCLTGKVLCVSAVVIGKPFTITNIRA